MIQYNVLVPVRQVHGRGLLAGQGAEACENPHTPGGGRQQHAKLDVCCFTL